jgi:hypothetical protein
MNSEPRSSFSDADISQDDLDKKATYLRRFRLVLSLLVLLCLTLAVILWWQVLGIAL